MAVPTLTRRLRLVKGSSRRRSGPLIVLVVASACVAAAPAAAPPVALVARMTASQEVPRQAKATPTATGVFRARVEPSKSSYRLVWSLTFRGLSGAVTTIYIHEGTVGHYGAALVLLCSNCKSGARGSNPFPVEALELAKEGKLYVNLRTRLNPSGETRGQIHAS